MASIGLNSSACTNERVRYDGFKRAKASWLPKVGKVALIAVSLRPTLKFPVVPILVSAVRRIKAPAAMACPVQDATKGRGSVKSLSNNCAPDNINCWLARGPFLNTFKSKPPENIPVRPLSTTASASTSAWSNALFNWSIKIGPIALAF